MASFINFNKKKDEGFGSDEEYYGRNDGFGNDEWEKDDEGEEVSFGASAAASAPTPTPVEPAAFGASVSLKIVNPKSIKDAEAIADYLMNGNTVLLNFENIEKDQAVRLLDYLAGATHAVGGIMNKVGGTTIVVAPKNVDVSSIESMVSGN